MLSVVISQLKSQLAARPVQRVWIAYSGGMDSHVLLHAFKQLQATHSFELHAIHVHHGLNKKADEWAVHSEKIVQQLGLQGQVIRVNAKPTAKESIEEAARNARYAALEGYLKQGDYLVTGHHADDQAETFLLQLLRGAGTKGLSAMPVLASLGQGFLWRPFLMFTREILLDYATSHKLHWIEDDSNAQLQFDRNYIRHQVVPSFKNRWPRFINNICQSAQHCAQAESILEERANQDLRESRHGACLNLTMLRQLSPTRRHNVLRHWLKQQNFPLPNRVHLQQFETAFIDARQDANPQLCWSTIQLRRYQNYLYVLPNPYQELFVGRFQWDLRQPFLLPDGSGQLTAAQVEGEGIDPHYLAEEKVEIRFRQGGETIQPVNHPHTRNLKKWLQSLKIPVWERGRIPLVYVQNELAQVLIGSISYTAKKFTVTGNEKGWVISELETRE